MEIIRKLIKKRFSVKAMFTLTFAKVLLFEVKMILAPAQQCAGSKKVKFSAIKRKQQQQQQQQQKQQIIMKKSIFVEIT